MKLTVLFAAMLAAFSAVASPNIIQVGLPASVNGASLDASSTAVDLAQLALNGQSAAGGVNFVASAASSLTLTGLGNFVYQFTVGSAATLTVDSAYNLVQQLPQPLTVGEKFAFQVHASGATTIATPTLSDTAVTLAGTTSVLAGAMRWYQGSITQLYSTSGITTTPGTTFTSLTQVGSTNNYTVALGTNAVTPTVRQLVYLAVTTGTLPSGWYPINKVTSATSFVIAAPAAAAAWTATAATVGTNTTAPSTFSPLVTITGLFATATAIVTV